MVRFEFYDPDKDKTAKRPKARKTKHKRSKGSSFTMDWVSELGWEANPFDKTGFPLAAMEDERQEINLFFVKEKRFGVIQGPHGMGKTILLKWLDKELNGYNHLDNHIIDASTATSDARFRTLLADDFRGAFSRGSEISREDLVGLITKKARGRYTLLIDNAQLLDVHHMETLEALLHMDVIIVLGTTEKLKHLPAQDELGIVLKKRSPSEYRKILQSRIESVGGEDIRPYTNSVVKRMATDTNTTQEFLQLALETAINIALKRVTLESDVPDEQIAASEEAKAERKSGITHKENPKKKRKYDELIESLTEELE